jgi:hypothetical protein
VIVTTDAQQLAPLVLRVEDVQQHIVREWGGYQDGVAVMFINFHDTLLDGSIIVLLILRIASPHYIARQPARLRFTLYIRVFRL